MKPTVFFHVPKTAGSSFVREAREQVGEDGVVNWTQSLKIDSPAPLISGHVPAHYLEPWINERFSFTILRDPVERAWSFCRYKAHMVGNNHHPAEEFLMDVSSTATERQLWNRTVTQLGGDFYKMKDMQQIPVEQWLENALVLLGRLDMVLFTETFDEHQEALWEATELDYSGPHYHNVTPGPDPEVMPGEWTQRLLDITKWDRMLYNAAREEYGV